MFFSLSIVSLVNALGLLVVFLVVRRIYYELTTGATRRAIIKEYGCKPIYQFPHNGILGKIMGLDILQQQMKDDKVGRAFEGIRHRFFTHQNTVKTRLFAKDYIQTAEPEVVKTILSTKFDDFQLTPVRIQALAPVIGHGIFVSNGPAWERSRALIRPSFTRSQVADLDIFETHIQHLIGAIPRDGSTVDLQPLFFAFALDSATEFLFGTSTNSLVPGLETDSTSEMIEASAYVAKVMFSEIRSAGMRRWVPDRKWHKSKNLIHAFADSLIHEAIVQQASVEEKKPEKTETVGRKERYVFLYELLKQTQDPEQLRTELLNIFFAAKDSTAGLLSNLWFQLARRPDIWAKLQAEVDELHGQCPNYADVKDMKYMRWVMNECLRVMPIAPVNARIAIRDTVLPVGGGEDGTAPAFLPKNSVIIYHPWSMHRRKDFFGEDANEFRPERWEELRPGWEYLPFNGGPRICPGQQFALVEASYTTIRLMQAFPRIEPRDEREWRENATLALASGVGCKVALFAS